MVNEEKIILDEIEDDITSILDQMNQIPTWTSAKRELHELLVTKLKANKYVSFSATNPNRYHIQAIGQHYLYDVPMYKRGVLKKFRGKRVRIICTSSGSHTWRGFMAGIAGETPPDKLISKLTEAYSFPSLFDSHVVLYQSPRFRAIQITENEQIKSDNGELLDLRGWNGLILDGKNGKVIALVNKTSNSEIVARGISQAYTTNHSSLRSVIERYARL